MGYKVPLHWCKEYTNRDKTDFDKFLKIVSVAVNMNELFFQ